MFIKNLKYHDINNFKHYKIKGNGGIKRDAGDKIVALFISGR